MAEAHGVTVPRESVNDDVVVLARWHVRAGEKVRAGEPLFDMETSKAAIQVDAARDGYLEPLAAEGDEVAVGSEVGRIHDTPIAAGSGAAGGGTSGGAGSGAAGPAGAGSVGAGGGASGATAAGGPAISRKARELIDARGLDPSLFAHLPHVREADVIRHLESVQSGRAAAKATTHAAPAPDAKGSGDWLKDASVASRERGKGVVWLAFNYLFRNYLLGHLVAIAPRGVILPLHRLRGVKIGKGCYVDPTAILETAYPENVTIGNDVRVTARAVIMTHIKAPHYLRETGIVPNVLKPVVLEDHCFIGVAAVIMPGVTVGKASVVASGAVVLGDVPPYTMVAGNPARVIRRFPRPEGGEGGR